VFHVCAVTNSLQLSDKQTNAHINMFSHILLFFTTCFGHCCDHHQCRL